MFIGFLNKKIISKKVVFFKMNLNSYEYNIVEPEHENGFYNILYYALSR